MNLALARSLASVCVAFVPGCGDSADDSGTPGPTTGAIGSESTAESAGACDPPLTLLCDGECIDPLSDARHCGSSGSSSSA